MPTRTADEELELEALQNKATSLRATFASLLSLSLTNASNLLTIVQPAVAPDQPSARARSPPHSWQRLPR